MSEPRIRERLSDPITPIERAFLALGAGAAVLGVILQVWPGG